MASTATAAASLRLAAFPLLSASASSSSSSSSTLRFPLRRRGRASRPLAVAAFKKLSEASPVPIPQEPTQPLVDEDALPPRPGVYGVYDPAGELQFVGISRNVRASVEGHRRKVPADLFASVKVAVSDEDTLDRAALNNAWKSWIQEHIEATGKAPPGNVAGNYLGWCPPEASRLAVDAWTPCPANCSTRTVDRPVGEGEQSGSLHQRIKECSPVWILTKGGGYLGSTWSGFRNCRCA